MAEHGCSEILDALIKNGADVTAKNESGNGETALHNAAYWNHIACTQILIDAGSDVNKENWYGSTPLHYAVEGNNFETTLKLLAHGADMSISNDEGFTPLEIAQKEQHTNALKAFADYKRRWRK